ncbi:hypothetical protein RFI_02554 [Reticulomyxa filosa]|uniref:Uncharacterized protein n=1 Tax=Reticulomyxa filosa TaxID=46433 RepID=X6P8U9_RETFI|nr:hypothetical protein RFI_02554 [Reticulomyxa filosa]|eukprot:ETO34538.1 hypothetical protein RFI_02554 [Reticulomyxa filosa]
MEDTNRNANTSADLTYKSEYMSRSRRNFREMTTTDSETRTSEGTCAKLSQNSNEVETTPNKKVKKGIAVPKVCNKMAIKFIVIKTIDWDASNLHTCRNETYLLHVDMDNRFIDLVGSLYDCGFVFAKCRYCGTKVKKMKSVLDSEVENNGHIFVCEKRHKQNMLTVLHSSIRIWLPLHLLLPIYAEESPGTTPTKPHVNGITMERLRQVSCLYQQQWTELPMDQLHMKFRDLKTSRTESISKTNLSMSCDDNVPTVLLEMFDTKNSVWPIGQRYHPNSTKVAIWDELRIGDMVQACDRKQGWFAGYIRMMDCLKRQVCVHWLFWDKQRDEWVPLRRVKPINNYLLYYNLPFDAMNDLKPDQLIYQQIPLRRVFGSKDITHLLTQVSDIFCTNKDIKVNDKDCDVDIASVGDWSMQGYFQKLQHFHSLKQHITKQTHVTEIAQRDQHGAIETKIKMYQEKLKRLEMELHASRTKILKQSAMEHRMGNLCAAFKRWREEIEMDFLEWKTEDVKCWVKCILDHNLSDKDDNNNNANQEIMNALLAHVEHFQVCGKDLIDINDLLLLFLTFLHKKCDRNTVLLHVNKLKNIHAKKSNPSAECPTCCGSDAIKGLVPCGHIGFCTQCALRCFNFADYCTYILFLSSKAFNSMTQSLDQNNFQIKYYIQNDMAQKIHTYSNHNVRYFYHDFEKKINQQYYQYFKLVAIFFINAYIQSYLKKLYFDNFIHAKLFMISTLFAYNRLYFIKFLVTNDMLENILYTGVMFKNTFFFTIYMVAICDMCEIKGTISQKFDIFDCNEQYDFTINIMSKEDSNLPTTKKGKAKEVDNQRNRESQLHKNTESKVAEESISKEEEAVVSKEKGLEESKKDEKMAAKAHDPREHVTLVLIGHSKSGKSATSGQIM